MSSFAVPTNAAFDNFNELIGVINDWMDREDLTGSVPSMIALAEDEIRLELEPLYAEAFTSVTTGSTGMASLPLDIKRLKRVMYDGSPVKQFSVRALDDLPDTASAPLGYTLERDGLRVWPSGEYTLDLLYDPFLPRLSVNNQTTDLLDMFPSLYFYGAMTFAAGYVVDDSRAANFRALFDNMLSRVKTHYRDQKHAGPANSTDASAGMMQSFQLPAYLPDQTPNSGTMVGLRNAYPITDGFAPIGAFQAISDALPADFKGGGAFISTAGVSYTLVGTAGGLSRFASGAWTDLLTGLSVTGQWRFVSFGDFVIAVNGVQTYEVDLVAGTASVLTGAPAGKSVAVVGDYVVIGQGDGFITSVTPLT